jgi:hypothetical protein
VLGLKIGIEVSEVTVEDDDFIDEGETLPDLEQHALHTQAYLKVFEVAHRSSREGLTCIFL